MARTFSGSGQYLSRAFTPIAVSPLMMACWFNCASPVTDGVIMGVGSTVAGKQSLYKLGIIGGKAVFTIVNSAGTSIWPSTAPVTIVAGTWYHVFGQVVSTSARSIYLNGVFTAGTAGSGGAGALADFTTLSIGNAVSQGTWQTPFKGTIAFPAFWNTTGVPVDVPPLAAKGYPILSRFNYLVSCSNLIGASPEPDMISATGWTLTGAPIPDTNPPIYFPC
jgi:hypothetical protein